MRLLYLVCTSICDIFHVIIQISGFPQGQRQEHLPGIPVPILACVRDVASLVNRIQQTRIMLAAQNKMHSKSSRGKICICILILNCIITVAQAYFLDALFHQLIHHKQSMY